MKRYKRLTEALCEAVEFGVPTAVKMGPGDFTEFLASFDDEFGYLDLSEPRYEDVPIKIERDRKGCIVEHDERYMNMAPLRPLEAVPETVAMDRSTRKPIIVAW